MHARGRIINEQDNIEEGIWCIGPMRKAVLWETTALRELRETGIGAGCINCIKTVSYTGNILLCCLFFA